jgi:hypothetical protein
MFHFRIMAGVWRRSTTREAGMATNAAVLLIVAATAALVLAGMLAVVVSKTRTRARDGRGAPLANESAIQATSYRSEAVTTRDQLNEHRVHHHAG